jgi:hypothetical protein
MIKMKSKRFVSLLLSALMVLTMFAGLSLTSSAAEAAEAPNELILHCWCWNFNNIKANMTQICVATSERMVKGFAPPLSLCQKASLIL